MSEIHSNFETVAQFFDVEAEAQMSVVFQHFSISNELFAESVNLIRSIWKESVLGMEYAHPHRFLWNGRILNIHCLVCAYLVSKKYSKLIDIKDIRDHLGSDFSLFRKNLLRYNFGENSASRIQNISALIDGFEGPRDLHVIEYAKKLIAKFPIEITNTSEKTGAATAIAAAYRLLRNEGYTSLSLICRKYGVPKRSVEQRVNAILAASVSSS